MTELLANHVAGRWQHGTGPGTELRDPVLGTALVRAALDWAAAEGLKVRPSCSYVRVYMQRHPQTQTLRV